jgi:putative hydrolase of the HAD superfamily
MSARPAGPFRAVLFDFGGVLTTPLGPAVVQFCAGTGVNPDRMRDLLTGAYSSDGAPFGGGDLVRLMEVGRLDPREFERRIAPTLSEGLSQPLSPDGLIARMFAGVDPEPRMLAVARAVADRGLHAAVVSNTWGRNVFHPDNLDGFDVVVLSGEEGVRKPDPEIYRRTVERIGVAAEACVFIDDFPANVQGAAALGMTAIEHRDPAVTIPELERLLGVGLA